MGLVWSTINPKKFVAEIRHRDDLWILWRNHYKELRHDHFSIAKSHVHPNTTRFIPRVWVIVFEGIETELRNKVDKWEKIIRAGDSTDLADLQNRLDQLQAPNLGLRENIASVPPYVLSTSASTSARLV